MATIKPASPKDNVRGLFTYPGGRIVCSLCTVQYLMMEAFDLRDWQITGGPNWARDADYQIEAKPPETSQATHLNNTDEKMAPSAEQRQMLQSLLMERFQLKTHHETRQGAVYILERARKHFRCILPQIRMSFTGRGASREWRSIAGPALRAGTSRCRSWPRA